MITNSEMALEDLNAKLDLLLNNVSVMDTKLSHMDTKLSQTNERMIQLELKFDEKFSVLEEKIRSLEDSQDFISKQYDKVKLINDNLITEHSNHDQEIIKMKQNLDKLNNELDQERTARNISEQYLRTSYNVKLGGIPIQPNEDESNSTSNTATRDIVEKVAVASKMTNFNVNQIDVCHRLGKNIFSPIIIKFYKKADRFNFFNQKGLLKSLTLTNLNFKVSSEQVAILNSAQSRNSSPGGRGGGRQQGGRSARWFDKDGKLKDRSIFLQESLTELNGELLKLAKDAAIAVGYKYTGYTVKGQVRVKLSDGAKYIPINSKHDLVNIK